MTDKKIVLFFYFLTFCSMAISDVPFHKLLMETGERLNIYFTIEALGDPASLNNWIGSSKVPLHLFRKAESAEDVLNIINKTELKQTVFKGHDGSDVVNRIKLMAVLKNYRGSEVIMISDKRIGGLREYPMNDKIKLSFRGTEDQFMKELSGENSSLVTNNIVASGGMKLVDASTTFKVESDNDSVRNVLLNAVDWKKVKYSRVIMSINSYVEKGNVYSIIDFNGIVNDEPDSVFVTE